MKHSATGSPRTRLQGGAALRLLAILAAVGATAGCRGPDERAGGLRLRVDTSLLARDWADGPRRDAIAALVERQGRDFARHLFRDDPMPSGMPGDDMPVRGFASQLVASAREEGAVARHQEPPAWWQGVPAPPDAARHDLPRAYLIEVQRGETMGLLARWSRQEIDRIRDDNREKLGSRKWLRPGDTLELTMSANQKLAFDQARERFQRDRLDAYFAKRYVERVVVYVVQRGDMIAKVARQYGEAPIWLLEAFNQTDFRSLQPGDTILIPVVKELRGGRHVPPPLQVVDGSGHAIADADREKVEGAMPTALLQRARLAIDDSNVFERPGQLAAQAPSLLPRPEVAPRAPEPLAPEAAVAAAPPMSRPAVLPAVPVRPEAVAVRQVVVKRGETLSHLAAWSGLPLAAILGANPGLDPDRVAAGQKVMLPLSDLAYADFVLARAGGLRAAAPAAVANAPSRLSPPPPTPVAPVGLAPRPLPARIGDVRPKVLAPAPAPAPPAAPALQHTVASGETGLGIAARYGVTLGALAKANPERNLDRLFVGDTLAIPAGGAPRQGR